MTDPKRVSPEEAKVLIDEGYTYLDVRTQAEWAAGHPAGAHNVPFLVAGPGGKMVDNPEFLETIQKVYAKDRRLVVGCKAGGRSLRAARALLDAGYSDVIDQRAGFEGVRDAFGQLSEKGWAPSGLPVEKETPGASYEEVKALAAR